MARSPLYLDETLLKAARAEAARTNRQEADVVEEALREHLGLDVIDVVRRRSDLTDEEAMRLAVEEVHAVREERAARRRP